MWGPLARLSRRQLLIGAAGAVVGAIVIVVLVIVLTGDAPPPATIESAVESVRQEEEQTAASAAEQDDAADTEEQSQQGQEETSSEQAATQGGEQGQQSQSGEPQSDAASMQEDSGDAEVSAGAYGDNYGSDDEGGDEETIAAADEQGEPEQEQQARPAAPTALVDLAGAWTLSERGESFVGYRIGEELANIGTATAVGRTSDIIATLEFDGSEIMSVVIEADLRTLRSDQSFRDSALRTRGLESDTYPFATFTLTESIPIADLPASAEVVRVECVRGTLELHGVTNEVCIALEGQLVDGELVVVVGSTEIALADYEIEPPTGFRVLSIEEVGLMEFQIVFERAE